MSHCNAKCHGLALAEVGVEFLFTSVLHGQVQMRFCPPPTNCTKFDHKGEMRDWNLWLFSVLIVHKECTQSLFMIQYKTLFNHWDWYPTRFNMNSTQYSNSRNLHWYYYKYFFMQSYSFCLFINALNNESINYLSQ